MTTDAQLFEAGVDALVAAGFLEPAFLSIARIAQDALAQGPINGGDGSPFPGPFGFCIILFTDEQSNNDPLEFDEVDEIVAELTLPSGQISPFVGFVPGDSEGDLFRELANKTNGFAATIEDFRSDPTTAQNLVQQTISACAQAIQANAGCRDPLEEFVVQTEEPPVDYPVNTTLEAVNVTCPDGSDPLSALWFSKSSAVTVVEESNPAFVEAFALGQFDVCLNTTCANPAGSPATSSTTCCTSLTVNLPPRKTLVAVQATVNDIGGLAPPNRTASKSGKGKSGKGDSSSRRRELRAYTTSKSSSSGKGWRRSSGKGSSSSSKKQVRAEINYGGPMADFGITSAYTGEVSAFSVTLKYPIEDGRIKFYIIVNGDKMVSAEALMFSPTYGGKSQFLKLVTPIAIAAGDLIEIGLDESRFAEDMFDTLEDTLPEGNVASVVTYLEVEV